MLHTALLSTFAAFFPAFSPIAPPAAGTGGGTVTITCPDTGKVFCGSPTTPEYTGEATATSTCPGNVTITYVDASLVGTSCLARRFDSVIQRTWTATDACGNTASCTQMIDIVRQIWSLDIKPTSCPNPIQVGSNGGNAQVSIAILGNASQSVANIDPASIAIWREDCTAGPVFPNDAGFQDVAAPILPAARCECTTAGPDGFMDLRLRFSRLQLVNGLGLANQPQGSYHRLVVTGSTFDGCEFVATDCVRIQ